MPASGGHRKAVTKAGCAVAHERASRVRATAAADAVLPPLQNALLTTALIAAALLVALTLPDASSSLFALTGATGVCAIGYAFPIFAYWRLPPEYGGVNTPQVDYLVSRTTSEPYNPLATPPPSRHGRPQWLQSLTSFPFFTSQHHLSPRSAVNAYGPASDPEVTLLSRIRNLLLARVWPTSVLLLGSIVSLMTLLVVFTKLQDGETRCEA